MEPGPAFTIQTRHRDSTAAGGAPGPSDYFRDAPAGPSGPAFSMPKAQRVEAAADATPAPGEYAVEAPRDAPAFTIRTKLPDASARQQHALGPGEYEEPRASAGPAYTMAGKAAVVEPVSPVGPGHYNDAPVPTGPAFTMQVRAAHAAPAPAFRLRRTDAWLLQGREALERASKEAADAALQPGPSTYEPRCDVGAGPAFSIPKVQPPAPEAGNCSPGPGASQSVRCIT